MWRIRRRERASKAAGTSGLRLCFARVRVLAKDNMVQTWSRGQAASTPGRARFRPPVAVSGRAAQSGYALGQGLVEPQAARVIDNLVGAFLDREDRKSVV